MSKPLIAQLETSAHGALSDEYLAIAYTIEESLRSAGAVAGKDYNILDLYKLAQPFVLELFKNNEKMEYSYASRTVV